MRKTASFVLERTRSETWVRLRRGSRVSRGRPEPSAGPGRFGKRSWPELVRHYGRVHRPRNLSEREWFRTQPTLAAAVKLAGLAENERGRRYRHQCRISRVRLEEAARLLSKALAAIRRARNFYDLFQIVEACVGDVPGIGELYVYDTSFRIGSKLGLLPQEVYLHTSTRQGAPALGLDGPRWLEVNELPVDLRTLPAYEIEDMLCLYKDRIPHERGCA